MNVTIRQTWERFRAWQLAPFANELKSSGRQLCSNCGREFVGNYCPYCSQRAGLGRVNWQSVRQSVGEVWGMGNRSMSHSLLQLFFRPGYFIRDYISGKRQVSFPPVKMLLIIALVASAAIHYWGAETVSTAADFSDLGKSNALVDFAVWADANKGWGMLAIMSMMVLPTWLLFRHAPGYNQHTVPEGFFIQVFMGILLVIFLTLDSFEVSLAMWLSVVYYFITYHQLFGYGWWPTIWRTLLCWYGAVMVGITIAAIYEVPARAKNDLPRLITEMAVTAVVMLLFAVVPLGLGYLIGHFNERRHRQSIIAKTKTKEYVQEDCTDNNDACVGSADASAEATGD